MLCGKRCSHSARRRAFLAFGRFFSGEPGCDKVATKPIIMSRSAGEPSDLGAVSPTGTSMETSASRDRAETGCL